MTLELITGPARSGKSRWAEHRASLCGLQVHYFATGPQLPDDPAWQERLRQHRLRRPPSWRCLEVGHGLAGALDNLGPNDVALVDSLGTWVSGALALETGAWHQHCQLLLGSLGRCSARVLMVSEQTGWGVVPATPLGGLFRDRLGRLEEQLSHGCEHLWLVVAGRALDLLPASQAVPPE